MALSNAERQRRKREKAKAEKEKLPDLSKRFIHGSFASFFEKDTSDDQDGGDWKGVEEVFAYAGVSLPDLTKNEWPEFEQLGLASSDLEGMGSLGRAEMLVGAFQEGLRVLADKINRFKQAELAARLKEFKNRDLTTQEARLEAVEEGTTIRIVSKALKRTTRLNFPEYEIKG